MRTYNCRAIVLKRINLGEKDRILTLYTREYGKVSAVAKGARRPGSKLAGASEPFTYAKMQLATGKELEVLTQAEIKESFPNAKANIESVAYAIYLMELVNSFVDDKQANLDLFDSLLSSMYILESQTNPEITARYFELNLLSIMGYEPHVNHCISCGHAIGLGKVAYSPSVGGIACGECSYLPTDAVWVPGAVISYINALQDIEPHKLKGLNFPKGALRDIAKILRLHIRYRLEYKLKSTEFIDTLDYYESECSHGKTDADNVR